VQESGARDGELGHQVLGGLDRGVFIAFDSVGLRHGRRRVAEAELAVDRPSAAKSTCDSRKEIERERERKALMNDMYDII
jgi:hypothetical protein